MIFDFEPGDKVFNPVNKDWGIGQVQSIINKKITKKKSKILLLGVTYKPDINDTRESAGIKLIELLLN